MYNFLNFIIDCPTHLNKPKASKRKQPTERKLVTSKKKKQNDSQPESSNHMDDLPDDWLPVEVQDGQLKDPVFDPTTCSLPPSWYWSLSKDQPPVLLLIIML